MKKEEIIEMARQVGFVEYELDDGTTFAFDKRFEAFAKLVADKATDEANARSNAAWALMCKKMVADEREACAKLAQETICDTHIPTGVNIYGTRAAKAIRARGEALASPIIKSYLEKDNLEENLYGLAIKADNVARTQHSDHALDDASVAIAKAGGGV